MVRDEARLSVRESNGGRPTEEEQQDGHRDGENKISQRPSQTVRVKN